MDKRYQVFISSTYSDLKEERSLVMQTIMSLNCIPAGMELFPASNAEQFEFIKRIINDCDYYVLIIGGRYGSLSEDGISYTEKEFDYAREKGLPILAFLHSDLESIPLGKSEMDPAKRRMLSMFRDKVSSGRLIKFWRNPEDLVGQVATSLSMVIMQSPAVGWVRANMQSTTEALRQENNLRKELADIKQYVAALEKERDEAYSIRDIASLEDSITVHFTYSRWSPTYRRDITKPCEMTFTWGDLFGAIAPRLMSNPNEDIARQHICEVIKEKSGESGGRVSLKNEDFDTVKIQFVALGLINVSYLKTVSGGMALFWILTARGNSVMMQRRVVKL